MTLDIKGETLEGYGKILSLGAREFLVDLTRKFRHTRDELLAQREKKQALISSGKSFDFLSETEFIRTSDWQVAPIPPILQDRRVEITGPAEPKTIINALNSGAKVFMADIEDSLSPTWEKIMGAQLALREAVRGTLEHSENGKHYKINENPAVLIMRPRGWHLDEKHVLLDDKPVPAALFDFAMFFFHNAETMIGRGTGPFFYLPKLESHKEAALWHDVFAFAEEALRIEKGTIKATVLIETIDAAFEMDEILYALKDYAVALNCGRWDYIFSFIKQHHALENFVLPDRAEVTMQTHFLKSYSELLIQTCHKRGALAMGGMAAQIPVKNDEAANELAFRAVKNDKEREVKAGHDGTWVAHPALIPVAMEVFNEFMPASNQLDKVLSNVEITTDDLLRVPAGSITQAGIRANARVSIQYIAAWLEGQGCVPINNLMEDAATAEISRVQLWQWSHHALGVMSETGENITVEMLCDILSEELKKLEDEAGENGSFPAATDLMIAFTKNEKFTDFLTLDAYKLLD